MGFVDEIESKKILVIGDIMLDEYYKGSVKRISPEAPVPVFLKKHVSYRMGGAANVAINLSSNQQSVSMLTIVGKDENGRTLLDMMTNNGIDTSLILKVERPTSTKTRLLAGNNQQVLRLDDEDSSEIGTSDQDELLELLEKQIADFDIIIISDYMKGLLTVNLTQKIIRLAAKHNIKVLVDVKDKRIEKYENVFMIKPNKKELEDLTSMPTDSAEHIEEAALCLLNKTHSSYVLVTLGADGMMLVGAEGVVKRLKTASQEVYDVTGAGDTVIAYLGLCVANGFNLVDAMTISNYAAGIQVAKVGTSSVRLDEVNNLIDREERKYSSSKDVTFENASQYREKNKGKRIVFTNGCFDILHSGHVRYLNEAASLGDVLIVGLNSDSSVKRLKGEGRPINSQEDRAEVIKALRCVDYVVVFDDDTPYELISRIKPDVLVKGGDYKPYEVVGKDIVESNGGSVVIIPFVEGKSTTNIVNHIREKQDHE